MFVTYWTTINSWEIMLILMCKMKVNSFQLLYHSIHQWLGLGLVDSGLGCCGTYYRSDSKGIRDWGRGGHTPKSEIPKQIFEYIVLIGHMGWKFNGFMLVLCQKTTYLNIWPTKFFWWLPPIWRPLVSQVPNSPQGWGARNIPLYRHHETVIYASTVHQLTSL